MNASDTNPSLNGVISYGLEPYAAWARMVRTNGPWDHKPMLREKLNLSAGNHHIAVPGDDEYLWYYDMWSNIHYGYVGRAAGFTGEDLQWGGNAGGIAGANDEYDILSTQIGIDLWDQHGSSLTKQQLHDAILSHREDYVAIRNRYLRENPRHKGFLKPIGGY